MSKTYLKSTTVRAAMTLAVTAAATLATAQANASFDIEGNTLLFTDSAWYQVQTTGTYVTICNGASSCTVAAGNYIVINHTTGERWESVSVPEAAAGSENVSETGSATDPEGESGASANNGSISTPGQGETTRGDLIIAGNLLTFATTDWFQVQQSSDFQTVCEGVASCLLNEGSYIVVNHSTGTRYEDVLIGASTVADVITGNEGNNDSDAAIDAAAPTDTVANSDAVVVSAPEFDGVSMRWPDNGWYQIQNSADFSTICEGGSSCPVDSGSYIIINLTTGQRWEGFTVQTGVPASAGDDSIAADTSQADMDGAGSSDDDDTSAANADAIADDGTGADAGVATGGAADPVDEPPADEVVASAAPVVEGNTIIMSGDGWYQVQSATDYTTVCDGLNRCDVPRGTYIVINHTTGERWDDVSVFNTAGVWFGTTSYGEGVFVIDSENNLYGHSTRDDGIVETVFGDVDGTLQRYLHVASRNLDHGSSFNLLGERPENFNIFDMNDVDYDLQVTNEGQSLVNSGIGGNFSLTFATADDMKPISVLSIAGEWESRTAFCDIDCDLTLILEVSNSGFVSGSSRFNNEQPGQLAGSTAAPDNSNLYLQIEFLLNGDRRAGVVYFDRFSDSLILNTVGVDAGIGSLAAIFQRN